jgi:hypothetical protein
MDLGGSFARELPRRSVFEVYGAATHTWATYDLLPWRDDDPLHIQFEFDTKPIIPRISQVEGKPRCRSTLLATNRPSPVNVV